MARIFKKEVTIPVDSAAVAAVIQRDQEAARKAGHPVGVLPKKKKRGWLLGRH